LYDRREQVKLKKWIVGCSVSIFLLTGSAALAQGNGNGHGKGHGKHNQDQDEDRGHGYYHVHEQEVVRAWYVNHASNLPPGLAKKDRLPPGLESQLVTRGTLPPGLQKRVVPVPVELERQLPPPPPDCAHVFIAGSLVLLNRRSNVVVDVFAVAAP